MILLGFLLDHKLYLYVYTCTVYTMYTVYALGGWWVVVIRVACRSADSISTH